MGRKSPPARPPRRQPSARKPSASADDAVARADADGDLAPSSGAAQREFTIFDFGYAGDAGATAHYADPSYYAATYRDRRHDVAYYAQKAKQAARNPAPVLLGIGLALGAMAAVVKYKTKQVERENPPQGKFIEVEGI